MPIIVFFFCRCGNRDGAPKRQCRSRPGRNGERGRGGAGTAARVPRRGPSLLHAEVPQYDEEEPALL